MCELCPQAMGGVRAVLHAFALLPFVGRLLGNAKKLGQHAGGLIAGSDLDTHFWGGARILVQGYLHDKHPETALTVQVCAVLREP